MGVIEGRTWLEILSPPECRAAMATQKVGRIAFLSEGRPEIMPVNFVVDADSSVVFRTDRGTKLTAVLDQPAVAFEVDGVDPDGQWGWSVVVRGEAREIAGATDLRRAEALGLWPWVPGDKAHWIRIVPTRVTGRRILHGPGFDPER